MTFSEFCKERGMKPKKLFHWGDEPKKNSKFLMSDADLNREDPEKKYCEFLLGETDCGEIVEEGDWEEHQKNHRMEAV